MAEPQGALMQIGNAPTNSMASTAAAGNPMVADMLASMMQRGKQNQDYLTTQRAARDAELEKYARMVTQSQTPESQEAGMWGSMAEAASNVAPTWGNIGAMLGRVGGAYGKNKAMNQQMDIKNQAELAKQYQQTVKDAEARDQSAAMLKALTGGGRGTSGYEFRKNADGTTTAFSKATGQPVGTYGPQDIGKIASMTQLLAKSAFDKGEYATLDEALNWAQGEAVRRIGQLEAGKGNRTTPLEGNVGGLPTTPTPDIVEGGVEGPKNATFKIDVSGLDPADKEIVQRLIKRYQANPNEGTMNQTAQMINQLMANGSIKQTTTLPKKDVQTAAEKEAYGKTVGKNMGDTTIDLQKTGAAASDLIGNLNTLETLYKEHGEKIPEGAAGDLINTIKSGMTSFGIDVKGQGAADMVKAIATKQALQSRTADGQNLLPGAMSNYEDRLLQSMSPGLLMSHEGRLLAIQVAKAQMQMRVDLAAKAREYIKQNKRLDEGWFDVAADVAKKNPFLNEARIRSLEAYAKSLNKGK